MGRYVFKLPDVGEGIAEVEVVQWRVAVGETVKEDAPLIDVLTEKATVEIPSPRTGKVVSISGSTGEKLRVGSEIMVLETDAAGDSQAPAPPPAAARAPAAPIASVQAPPRPNPIAEKPRAAPSVRHRAKELAIALASVPGTGPEGRILHSDLDAWIALHARPGRPPPPPAFAAPRAAEEEVEEIRIIGLRRRIAERMQDSKRRIPHYSYVEELDVTALEELRRHLNARYQEKRPRLTVLPFLIRALVRAIPEVPTVNARFDDTAGILHRYSPVHAGIATETSNGLMVPVIRHAETLDLWQAAFEISRLAGAARDGSATREQLGGSTITITSLGPLGGIAATPVINPPEVAIVGVNRIVERPVVEGGQVVIRRMMNLSSSFDHRIVDGFDAARFIQEVKRLLEHPATLFMP